MGRARSDGDTKKSPSAHHLYNFYNFITVAARFPLTPPRADATVTLMATSLAIIAALLAGQLVVSALSYGSQRRFMSTTAPGLAALQTFVATFQTFVTQQTTDLASLTTNITAAITTLGNSNASEDPAVQSAVASLNTALGTVTANETSLEALNASLGTADNPTSAAGVVAAVAKKA